MKRRNPVRTIRKHPDLFEGDTPVVFDDWRDVETWRLEDMTDDYIDAESLEEIKEEEPEVYKAIMRNSSEAQDERVKPMLDYFKQNAKWLMEQSDYYDDQEWLVDYFIDKMRYMSNEEIVGELGGDDELEALVEAFDADMVGQILRDPSNYELSGEQPEYEMLSYNESSREFYVPGIQEDEDFYEAFALLRDDEDVQRVVEEMESAPLYLSFPTDFTWDNINDSQSFSVSVPVDFEWYWGTNDLDTIKSEISELEKVAESKDEGPETDNIVYRFPDGFYVAELRPNQLPMEGRRQGMCVGRADMGYIQAVIEGSTKIFSLRSPSGKPKLTFEWDTDGEVDQVKGKGNRLPGFAYGDHEQLRRPDEVRKAVEFVNYYLWWEGKEKGKEVMADEIEDLKPAMEVIGIDYDDEGRASLEPETTKWKIDVGGDSHLVEEVLSKGVDPSGIFNTKGQALHHIRTVLQPEAESVAEQGAYVRFYAVAVRENPEAAIPVPPHVQALAEEAFEHPWGGEW